VPKAESEVIEKVSQIDFPSVLCLTKQAKLVKLPRKFWGKFVIIPVPVESCCSIVVLRDRVEFHEQIVNTYSRYLEIIKPNLHFSLNRHTLLGGGMLRIEGKIVRAYDHSQQYGHFDEKAASECLKKAFPRREIQIDPY